VTFELDQWNADDLLDFIKPFNTVFDYLYELVSCESCLCYFAFVLLLCLYLLNCACIIAVMLIN